VIVKFTNVGNQIAYKCVGRHS